MSSAESSTPARLPATFRRLQRNDTEQTNEQWKVNLLRETGAVAPLWTIYARANKTPEVTMRRPREPVKPTDPEIMAEMKLVYRQTMAMNRNVPLAEIPPCSATVVW